MESRHNILLLDDDPDVLDMYKELLSQLPSRPEIHTASAGARALALLESEPFRLFICDLKMPKMDGLQVLSIVRRRFPELRTVVLTAVHDDEFRSRAYALGVDLFWLKPDTQENIQMFMECLESLLGRDTSAGFRGVQSKSLMDIIQMECLSLSSTVLRITYGALSGKIWIVGGELIHAEAEGATGEAAFRRILGWKSGTFENLPAEIEHERTINKPVNALLLEAAQAIDEVSHPAGTPVASEALESKTVSRLSALAREGAEWVVAVPATGAPEGCGTQAAEQVAKWVRQASESCRRISERIDAGPLSHMEGRCADRRLLLLPWNEKAFMVAWPPGSDAQRIVEQSRKLVASWDS
jgi:CheY-like chemotaxis protein